MSNVMKLTKMFLVLQAFYVLLNLQRFFTEGLFNTARFSKSVAALTIIGGCYLITRVTKNTVSMKLMPFLLTLNSTVFSNCILYYAFSEPGIREGQEQFGVDYPVELEKLVMTLTDVYIPFAISIIFISIEWLPSAILQSAIYLVGQNLINFQIHKHKMEKMENKAVDMSMLSFAAVNTVTTCLVFGLISYTMISTQASLFVKNQHSER